MAEETPASVESPKPKPPLWKRVLRELVWIGLFAGVYFALQGERAPQLAVGTRAPNIAAEVVGGGTISVDPSLAKPKVLVFWAPWCGVCKTEMPLISDLQEDFGDDAVVVGVALAGSRAEIAQFVAEKPTSFKHIYGDGKVDAYGVRAFPTIYILDKDNIVRSHTVGLTTPLRIKWEISRLLD